MEHCSICHREPGPCRNIVFALTEIKNWPRQLRYILSKLPGPGRCRIVERISAGTISRMNSIKWIWDIWKSISRLSRRKERCPSWAPCGLMKAKEENVQKSYHLSLLPQAYLAAQRCDQHLGSPFWPSWPRGQRSRLRRCSFIPLKSLHRYLQNVRPLYQGTCHARSSRLVIPCTSWRLIWQATFWIPCVRTSARPPLPAIERPFKRHAPAMNTMTGETRPVMSVALESTILLCYRTSISPTMTSGCLNDSQGNYCYLHLKSTDSQDECDECGLQMFQAEISNGYFYNDDLAEQFSSLTSSCGVSTLSVPTATSVVLR